MKYLVKTLALATAMSGLLSGISFAADDDIDILLAPESTLVEVGSGWYLRGDITATVNAARIIENSSVALPGGGTNESDTNFRDMIGFGIGFGYRLTNSFRVDATLNHFLSGESTSFRQLSEAEKGTDPLVVTDTQGLDPFNDTAEGRCGGWYINPGSGSELSKYIENCSSFDEASYNTFSLMGNGYFDLQPFGKFQPFVGAGVGIARVRWQETIGGTICAPRNPESIVEGCNGQSGTDQPAPNTVYKYGGIKQGGVDYRLAYSLTAGFGYRINDHLVLDASYRFMGVGNTMGITGGGAKAQAAAKNGFGMHQINFGLRYEIW